MKVANRATTLPKGGGPRGDEPIAIRKGQTIYYSAWTMHRRPDIFGANAADFNPERWATARPGWGYIPFSGGPRVCVGQAQALLSTTYIITRLMQVFERIESRDDRPFVEDISLTLGNFNGLHVALVKKAPRTVCAEE